MICHYPETLPILNHRILKDFVENVCLVCGVDTNYTSATEKIQLSRTEQITEVLISSTQNLLCLFLKSDVLYSVMLIL